MLRIILVALILLIAIVVAAVFILRPEPPQMPRDPDHVSSHAPDGCLSCHGPGEKHPRKPTHPNANDCFRCHTFKGAAS